MFFYSKFYYYGHDNHFLNHWSISKSRVKTANGRVKMKTKTLAEAVGISIKGVEKQLAKLKANGKIRRIGPAKVGHWEIEEG